MDGHHGTPSFDGQRRFLHGFREGFSFVCLDSVPARQIVDYLLPDPDELFRSANIFKPGTRTHGGQLRVAGIDCFLKRYNDRGLWYRFRHLFVSSRARRTWQIAWELLDAGIPVPQPMVCLEERRFRLLFRSYILMRFASGCERLSDAWMVLADREREALLLLLADIIAGMHRAGALHGDLKWDNILVAPRELTKVCLVDLDGSRFTGRFDLRLAEKDLQRFLRDLEQFGNTGMPEKFISVWRREVLK